MTILEWVLIGIGAVLFLGGAVMMLIGFLKKKSLILFKIVPGAAATRWSCDGDCRRCRCDAEQYAYHAGKLCCMQTHRGGKLSAGTACGTDGIFKKAECAVGTACVAEFGA